MLTGIYAGSFDIVTLGHVWVLKQAAMVFDTLYWTVGVNPNKDIKKRTFSVEDSMDLMWDLVKQNGLQDQVFVSFNGDELLADYAEKVEATHIIRGIRNARDYEDEAKMRLLNEDINPNVEHIHFMAPRNLSEISSSDIKAMLSYKGWEKAVRNFVPELVFNALDEKVNRSL